VASQVDLDRVLTLAATAGPLETAPPVVQARGAGPTVRIGIARDEAFGFYYPDDLAALQDAGAQLVPIDTLRDTRLPALDGLLIGGGFPEAFLPELEANAALRVAVRQAIAAGLPAYAECGGLMYLARSIRWNGRVAQMVGAIPGDVVMRERPVGRGYVRLVQTADHPWPLASSVAGSPTPQILGHEFHHSELVDADPHLRYAYAVQRGHGVDGQRDGVIVGNLLASYSHLRGSGGTQWPQRFVAFVHRCAERRHTATSPILSQVQGAIAC
jgi:cobyrinic acid a,c-diamide synthase